MKRDSDKRRMLMALYETGATYSQIAQHFNISKQAAWKAVYRAYDGNPPKRLPQHYPFLAKWIEENCHGSVSEFARQIGFNRETVRLILRGKRLPNMVIIDSILGVTGLTYEKAFYIKKGGSSVA